MTTEYAFQMYLPRLFAVTLFLNEVARMSKHGAAESHRCCYWMETCSKQIQAGSSDKFKELLSRLG